MILHELTPLGPFFGGALAIGGGVTATLAAVGLRWGLKALIAAAVTIALAIAFAAAPLLGEFGNILGYLAPILAVLAGLVALRLPIETVARFVRVTVEGAIATLFLTFGGVLFFVLIAGYVIVAYLWRARRRQVANTSAPRT